MTTPPSAPSQAPTCYRHPRRETYIRCTRCSRPICPDCMHEAAVGFQCPECVAEGRRTQRSARNVFGSSSTLADHGLVTKALIAINGVMLLFSALSAGSRGFSAALFNNGWIGSSTPLMEQLWENAGYTVRGTNIFVPDGVADGEYYRLITSTFMHFGLIHFALNMFALWQLGRVVEAALGPARFLTVYVLSGLGGAVAVYLFSPGSYTAGASGAVFGVFGAMFVILKRLRQSTAAVVPIIVINLFFTFAIPNISAAGHIGGLISGALVMAGFAYAPRHTRTAVQVATAVGFLALLTVATLAQTSALNS